MKKLFLSCLLSILFLSASNAQYGTERTGYEGDYFSLEGAIDLFKQSNSIRDFERKLNREDSWVNNLDLDYDGRTDYIRVEHRRQGNFHAIILQVGINRYDVQDVAVIEIEKTGRREAILQIVGDEDLYGEEVIVEPYENRGYSSSRGGPNTNYQYNNDYVNVYYWRPVQYIFDRYYQAYVSPYYWDYYPTWWSPWRQYGWSIFRPRIVVYHRHYHVVRVHRVIHVHNFYRPHRSYCHSVVQHTNKVRIKHGKKPINRPVVHHDKKRIDHQRQSNVVKHESRNRTNQRETVRNTKQEQKRDVSSRRPTTSTRTTKQAQKPRVSERRPTSSTRTTKQAQKPTVSERRPTSSTRTTRQAQKPTVRDSRPSTSNSRATKPTVTKRNPNSSSGTVRSNTKTQRPSASSKRPASSSNKKVTRSTTTKRSPAPKVSKQPRRTSSPSSTVRSSTKTQRSSASTKRSAPSSNKKVTRSTTTKKSSTAKRSSSGSRRGN